MVINNFITIFMILYTFSLVLCMMVIEENTTSYGQDEEQNPPEILR